MRTAIYIDVFSEGLDELTRKQQRKTAEVLAVIKKAGRYSVFEATANEDIARTMTRIVRQKLLVLDDARSAFPWTYATLSEAGERVLAEAATNEQGG